MKAKEECTCGASFEIEDANAEVVRTEMDNWRKTHRHLSSDPWTRSVFSTSPTAQEFGFVVPQERPIEVTL